MPTIEPMNLIRAVMELLAVAPVKKTLESDETPSAPWPEWADDRLGYWPVHDRGGAMSEYEGPGDRGMLGVLAQIEMNEEDGAEPDAGLPADALQPSDG